MYLHLGSGEIVPEERIIGIFDLDHCSCSPRGREFLKKAEAEGVVLGALGELPRSFLVCDHPYHRQIVYLSPLNSVTLMRRLEQGGLMNEA